MNKPLCFCVLACTAVHAGPTPNDAQLLQEVDALWQTAQALKALDNHWQAIRNDSASGIVALKERTQEIARFIKDSGVEAVRSHLDRQIALHQKTADALDGEFKKLVAAWQPAQAAVIAFADKLSSKRRTLQPLETEKPQKSATPEMARLVQTFHAEGNAAFKGVANEVKILAHMLAQLYDAQTDSLQLYWQAISNATRPETADSPIMQKAHQRLRDELRRYQLVLPTKGKELATVSAILQRTPTKAVADFGIGGLVSGLAQAIDKIRAMQSVVYVCVASGACPVAQTDEIPQEDILSDLVKYLDESIVPQFQKLQRHATALSQAKFPQPPPYRIDRVKADMSRLQRLCQQYNDHLQLFVGAMRAFITTAHTVKQLDKKTVQQLREAFQRVHSRLEQGSKWTTTNEYGTFMLQLYDTAAPMNLAYEPITPRRPALTFGLVNNGKTFAQEDMVELSEKTKSAFINALDALGDVAQLLAHAPAGQAGAHTQAPSTAQK